MTYPTPAAKVDIDRYFSEFESQTAPACDSTSVEVYPLTPAAPWADFVLPCPELPEPKTHRKVLSIKDIDRASSELVHLRCQLSHPASSRPQHRPNGRYHPIDLPLGGITQAIAGLSVLGLCLSLPFIHSQCRQQPSCQAIVARTTARLENTVTQVMSQRPAPQTITLVSLVETLPTTEALSRQSFSTPLQPGQDQGYQAAMLTQSAVTPDEWLIVVEHWEKALAMLAEIPADSPFYRQAQATITTYRQNLAYARSEIDPFREAVNSAMAAAVSTQTAQEPEQWSEVSQQWLTAIALLKQVSSTSPYYGLSQQKIAEYAGNLVYSQQQAIRP
jgi:hypothetical protein